jgi:8-oxo-dGTP diphosphatase
MSPSVSSSPTHPVDVFLLLADRDRVLLALRDGTGFADGQWNLPSGKLEAGEDAVTAVRRESLEEIGVRLAPEDLSLVVTVHRRNDNGRGRLGLVFAARYDPAAHGEPFNNEPHKCAGLDWFHAGELPANTFPSSSAGVAAWRAGSPLALSGWEAR